MFDIWYLLFSVTLLKNRRFLLNIVIIDFANVFDAMTTIIKIITVWF